MDRDGGNLRDSRRQPILEIIVWSRRFRAFGEDEIVILVAIFPHDAATEISTGTLLVSFSIEIESPATSFPRCRWKRWSRDEITEGDEITTVSRRRRAFHECEVCYDGAGDFVSCPFRFSSFEIDCGRG